MILQLSPSSIDDYRRFIRAKSLPRCVVKGRTVEIPDEYAELMTGVAVRPPTLDWVAPDWMYDYQRDIAATAIRKQKYACFVDCGLGKTAILLEFARHVAATYPDRKALIVSPLMVIPQTIAEAERFYGDALRPTKIVAKDLAAWLTDGTPGIGITNYDAMSDALDGRDLAGLILDESSMLKSHYGKWGAACIALGKSVPYKLALTGTPAPNDRIEFANHAVFLDREPTTNAFLARYFINRGQTENRWEIKAHAVEPFYRSLADWSIFLSDPAVYGWRDNATGIPPIHIHVHDVELDESQRQDAREFTGQLFASEVGGITGRTTLARIAKRGDNKARYIKELVDSWPDESTIIWCKYNSEQDTIAATFPDAANIAGDTPMPERIRLIDEFKSGRRKVLISKPKILGFGLNLQVATRQVFSGLQDSYEEFYQAVKRSNRIGSTRPLNVHIPVASIEMPMIETVLTKKDRIESDTRQQEEMYRNHA